MIDPIIELALTILGEDSGSIMTVPIGVSGLPNIVITTSGDEETLKFSIQTGSPFETTREGVVELADFLDALVDTLRSDEFLDAWEANRFKQDEEEEL